ncbi:MAG: hypothetical protein D6719_12720 [Candidatus Dadabacteria bacterium]|nr:MAG: hypothetical protein D6719_12720 [Candidatus Dadabacteria bacterium]
MQRSRLKLKKNGLSTRKLLSGLYNFFPPLAIVAALIVLQFVLPGCKSKATVSKKPLTEKSQPTPTAATTATPSLTPAPTGTPILQPKIIIGHTPIPTPPATATPPPLISLDELDALSQTPTPEEDTDQAESEATPSAVPTAEKIFTEEELQQLQAQGATVERGGKNSALLGAVKNSSGSSLSGGAVASENTPAFQTQDTPTPTPDQQDQLSGMVAGQPRGYVMLNLMHPAARQTINAQVQNMLDAKVRELYLGVLTDGTFSKDFNYFASVVRKLNTTPRSLTLVVYLTNGATMRAWDVTPITAGFNRIEPQRFRELIRFDPGVREEFLDMVREVKPVLDLNRSLNPLNRNIAIVMLEDNLDSDSYRAMRELAYSVLGDSVAYFRNPCQGCYPGNDSDSFGDPIELHRPVDLDRLTGGDGFTLDGVSYEFNEGLFNGSLSLEQVKQLAAKAALKRLSYFGLWRAERQGLRGDITLHPDRRSYEVPTARELELEQELLRFGLAELDLIRESQ